MQYTQSLYQLFQIRCLRHMSFTSTSLPGGNSKVEPPDPIPNSEVKRFSADGSVGLPHVRVGHCQALILKTPDCLWQSGVFSFMPLSLLTEPYRVYTIEALRVSLWIPYPSLMGQGNCEYPTCPMSGQLSYGVSFFCIAKINKFFRC